MLKKLFVCSFVCLFLVLSSSAASALILKDSGDPGYPEVSDQPFAMSAAEKSALEARIRKDHSNCANIQFFQARKVVITPENTKYLTPKHRQLLNMSDGLFYVEFKCYKNGQKMYIKGFFLKLKANFLKANSVVDDTSELS